MAEFNYEEKRYFIADDQVEIIGKFIITNFKTLPKNEQKKAVDWLCAGMLLKNDFKKDCIDKQYAVEIGMAKKKNVKAKSQGFSFLQPQKPKETVEDNE